MAVKGGGAQSRRYRLPNTKTASEAVKKRLKRNMSSLLDEPRKTLPIQLLDAEDERKGIVEKHLKKVYEVLENRHDKKWLQKRINGRRWKGAAAAYIGGFLAAQEDDFDMVMNFKMEPFGQASYVRRGSADASKSASLQNQDHPSLRLLLWEDLSRSGLWLFSIKKGVVCSGRKPLIPETWIDDIFNHRSIPFKKDNEGNWHHSNFTKTSSAPFLTVFASNQEIWINTPSLSSLERPLVHLFARRMLPPKVGEVIHAKVKWSPIGWDRELPESAITAIDDLLQNWLNLQINEDLLDKEIRATIIDNIDDGWLIEEKWYPNRLLFIQALQGNDLEIKLFEWVLKNLGTGWAISNDGQFTDEIEGDVVRIPTRSCHSLLRTLWSEVGVEGLEETLGIETKVAEEAYFSHLESGDSTGALLTRLVEEHLEQERLTRLSEEITSSAGTVLVEIINTALSQGLIASVNIARTKKSNIRRSAIGWAWLEAINRSEGQAWGFDEDARRTAEGWIALVKEVWDSAKELDGKPTEENKESYQKSMKKFTQLVGDIN